MTFGELEFTVELTAPPEFGGNGGDVALSFIHVTPPSTETNIVLLPSA